MIGRKAVIGACMLSALAFSALAAQSAAAATNGTTAFTCSASAVTKTFTDSHCTTGGGSSFGHVEVPAGTSTEFKSTGGTTKLHTVISGVEVELQATEANSTGTIENMVAASGEHTTNGTGTSEYKGVTVTKPEGKGCAVTGGEIKTKTLKATTTGQGMGLKFEPSGGTLFAEFNITGCSIAALNGKYEIKGSVIGTPEGATGRFTSAGTTAQGTLTLRGQKAGIDLSTAASARAKPSEAYTPLSTTTTATP